MPGDGRLEAIYYILTRLEADERNEVGRVMRLLSRCPLLRQCCWLHTSISGWPVVGVCI